MNELFECLNSKYSHQAIWHEYVQLIGMALKQIENLPVADEAIHLLSRVEITNNFVRRLARIAELTSKLQTLLNEDEQKILHLLNFEWIKIYWGKLIQK